MDSSSGSSQTSAWGGFLKKAMEGVEQQLDRVLENPPPKAREAAAQAAAKKENAGPGIPGKPSVGGGRMTLQERLAASIAKSRTGSPVMGSSKKGEEQQGISRSSSSVELTKVELNGLGSKDGVPGPPIRAETPNVPSSPLPDDSPATIEVNDVSDAKALPVRTETPDIAVIPAVDHQDPSQPVGPDIKADIPASPEPAVQDPPLQIPSVPPLPPSTDPAVVELISQLQGDLETCESRRIEEAQQASSRISSLEQKLKILSQSSLIAARTSASDPSATPLDQKLAEREEKIALLLDEGEKLAKIELNLMTTIKSLRAKQKEDATITTNALAKAEKAERQANDLKAQLKRANDAERKNVERLKGIYKIEAANEALRREKESDQTTIMMLRTALAEANARADEAVAQVHTEALENERRLAAELDEKLERLQTESALAQEQSKSEIQELKGRIQREQASSKALRDELTTEIITLESKLEVLRSREEESSTSATSSAQAKLMRQIEMLQTQHAIASQNWQRIEGSLQRRHEALEKEKFDLIKKLDEEKKKLRDAADAKRNVQNELDDMKRQITSLESEILKSQSENQGLQETIAFLEIRVLDQEVTFTKEKEAMTEQFELTLATRIKEEKTKWEEESQMIFSSPLISTPITPFPQLGLSSPATSRPSPRLRNSVSPVPEIQIPLKQRGSYPPPRTTSFGDISHLRRPSRPLNHPFESSTSLAPAPPEDEDEREFLSQSRGESPKNTAVDAASISASTSTAGPSVNIIERMSAAVRRLESDLTGAKEELARSVRQRDEAREECVNLMAEVEEKRKFQNANRQLQAQFDDLEVRYNEALVLLGEKSERVEELQMDIVDLKEGYQHALQKLVEAK